MTTTTAGKIVSTHPEIKKAADLLDDFSHSIFSIQRGDIRTGYVEAYRAILTPLVAALVAQKEGKFCKHWIDAGSFCCTCYAETGAEHAVCSKA